MSKSARSADGHANSSGQREQSKKAGRKSTAAKTRSRNVSGAKPLASIKRVREIDQVPAAEAFAKFADRVATGEIVVPPLLLSAYERRRHLRKTLVEDHGARLHNRPESVREKFETMAESPFRFFRGMALLFYRDYAGTDGDLPIVLCLGDVHPKNFGVMPSADGTPVFGPNDFDEAHFAPFSYDLKRGAVGFDLAAKEESLKKSERRAIVEAFGQGYVAALRDFAIDNREADLSMRIDNSPPMIRTLLECSLKERSKWLAKMIDVDKGEFQPTDEIVPQSSRVEEFQKTIDGYVKRNDLGAATRMTDFRVKDVALKKGSGTASLGLERYFVLIDGPTDDERDDIILELKQARPSAMRGLVPNDSADTKRGEADRVVTAQRVHVAGGDPYYGTAELGEKAYLVRERSPFKNSLDTDDLDEKGWCEYAGVCGRVLALAHARSDADSGLRGAANAEHAILESIDSVTFVLDLAEFANSAAKRVRKDWEIFNDDLRRGAFGEANPAT